jgi:hypothetical protein
MRPGLWRARITCSQEELSESRDDVVSVYESEAGTEQTEDDTIFRYQKLSPPVVYMGWVEIKGDAKAQAFKLSEDTLDKVMDVMGLQVIPDPGR